MAILWHKLFFVLAATSCVLLVSSHSLTQTSDIPVMAGRIQELLSTGKSSEARTLAEELVALTKAQLSERHPVHALSLSQLGLAHEAECQYVRAEELFLRALSILGREPKANASIMGAVQSSLARVYEGQGRDSEATALYIRARENEPRMSYKSELQRAQGLYAQAGQCAGRARYVEAERLYQRALTIYEAHAPASLEAAHTLNDLAGLYLMQGLSQRSEALYKRALSVYERVFSANARELATPLLNLGAVYVEQGRDAEAEALLKRAVAILEKVDPVDHRLATALQNIGIIYRYQGRAAAVGFFRRSLDIREKTLGPNHPKVAEALRHLAAIDFEGNDYDSAERLESQALAIRQNALGPEHPDVMSSLWTLGLLARARGRWPDAHAMFSRAAAIQIKRAGLVPEQRTRGQGNITGQNLFWNAAEASWEVAREKGANWVELEQQSFVAGQWAIRTTTGAALSQMAVRVASGTTELSSMVREAQDLSITWNQSDKRLIEAISAPTALRNEALIAKLRSEIRMIEERLAALNIRLNKDFPSYNELSSPKPLSLSDVQAQLSPDEAMISFVSSPDKSLVWAISRNAVRWRRIELGTMALGQDVAALRQGLDCRAAGEPARAGGCSPWQLPFNLNLAHELYLKLFGPVVDLIDGKRHLIIVASGPLTSLPFQALVTEKPSAAIPEHYASYRDPAWLIKRHAISVLPSVSSLKALRMFAKGSLADKPLIGFGDPIFSSSAARARQRLSSTRTFASYFKGYLGDPNKLAELDALPETAVELKSIARTLGVPESEIYLRERASETQVKRAPLERYRIVHFATHGLVAGELPGLAEPALALSVPREPSELDDGLLTASEVAQLKLNADWVILSACNTAAGDKPGAEALSGLARAFFYAGARALLVSHWPVESDAAVKLTTRTLAELKANPDLGRGEALRRAMLALMTDRDVRYAHPALWGPFMVVGEGGAERRRP